MPVAISEDLTQFTYYGQLPETPRPTYRQAVKQRAKSDSLPHIGIL
jgi:hypothetical protein